MKKNIKRAMGLMGSCVLLAGAVGCNNPVNNPISQQVIPSVNNSPSFSSNETVELTKGIKGGEVENINVSNISEEQLESLSNAYINLANQVALEDANSNMLISPFSVTTALGMTENGACNETLSQMEETVNGGLSRGELNSIMYFLSNNMNSSDDVDWNVANSLWMRDDDKWTVKQNFLNEVVTYYHPAVFKAPFDDSTVKDINSWIKKETHNMIPEVLDYIPGDAVMYLVNAVAFEGEWAEKYEDNDVLENRTFTNIDDSESKVTMLTSKENRYFTLGKGEGFIKPYKGGQYSFVGILPEEGVTPSEYLTDLADTNADFSRAIREASYEEVNVVMPEFDMDYDIELSDTYKKMGMDKPFDTHEADFTDMLEPTSGDTFEAWIGRILHKTHIEVDRKGTKAAAATIVEMQAKCTAAEPVEVRYIELNRPFVYAIVDKETGLPVFIGCQNTMIK